MAKATISLEGITYYPYNTQNTKYCTVGNINVTDSDNNRVTATGNLISIAGPGPVEFTAPGFDPSIFDIVSKDTGWGIADAASNFTHRGNDPTKHTFSFQAEHKVKSKHPPKPTWKLTVKVAASDNTWGVIDPDIENTDGERKKNPQG